MDDVLDFFELLGLLVHRGVIDEEMAWSEFYHWVSRYWSLTRDHVDRARRDNPTLWEYAIDIVRRLDRMESKRHPVMPTVPSPDDLAEFLADERTVGLDQLRHALQAECRSLVAQIPQLVAVAESSVACLQAGKVLPGPHVQATRVVYESVGRERAPYLTEKERNLLHVCYERLRVGDELLATDFGSAISTRLEGRRMNMPLTDPVGSYMTMLRDQIKSYGLVQRLLRSFLDGKPEDVFYVEKSAADRERAQYE